MNKLFPVIKYIGICFHCEEYLGEIDLNYDMPEEDVCRYFYKFFYKEHMKECEDNDGQLIIIKQEEEEKDDDDDEKREE